MLTKDICDLSPLFELLSESLLLLGISLNEFDGVHDTGRQQRREGLRDCLDVLRFSVRRLREWDEGAAAEQLQKLIDACGELDEDLVGQELVYLVRRLITRALAVNNELQALAPLAQRVSEVPWGPGDLSDTETWGLLSDGTHRRQGFLLALWTCREKAEECGELWSLVRRELSHVFALRTRPYKASTRRRDPEAKIGVPWRRSPVQVFRPHPEKPARRLLLEDPSNPNFLRPARSPFTLRYDDERWRPEELRNPAGGEGSEDCQPGLDIEAIGYFFVPGTSKTDGYGVDERALLELLMRLAWGLCALNPCDSDDKQCNRLGFRLFAYRVELEWQQGEPVGRDRRPSRTSFSILDRWSYLKLIPSLFESRSTRNSALVESEILYQAAIHTSWFRPIWYIPVSHFRNYGEPAVPWICGTPFFDGRPSWVERIDLSASLPRRPRMMRPGGGVDATADLFSSLERTKSPRRHRQAARVEPPRPLGCRLVPAEPGADGQPEHYRAFLLNYSASGCCILVCSAVSGESTEPASADRLHRLLGAASDFGRAHLEVGPGVMLPWGPLHHGAGGRVAVALPQKVPKHERLKQEDGSKTALRTQGVRIRLLVGSVVKGHGDHDPSIGDPT